MEEAAQEALAEGADDVLVTRTDRAELPRATAPRGYRVRGGEGDAHRLVHEDMKARIERCEHDLRVRAVRRADDDGVEAACIEHRAVVRVDALDPVAGRKRFAH